MATNRPPPTAEMRRAVIKVYGCSLPKVFSATTVRPDRGAAETAASPVAGRRLACPAGERAGARGDSLSFRPADSRRIAPAPCSVRTALANSSCDRRWRLPWTRLCGSHPSARKPSRRRRGLPRVPIWPGRWTGQGLRRQRAGPGLLGLSGALFAEQAAVMTRGEDD